MDDPHSITEADMIGVIREATLGMKITPVMCGSAFKNKGVQMLLNAIIEFLPSPLDVPPVTGINPKTDKEEIRKPDPNDHFSALAFKIATDPYVGRLAFFQSLFRNIDCWILCNQYIYRKERKNQPHYADACQQTGTDG